MDLKKELKNEKNDVKTTKNTKMGDSAELVKKILFGVLSVFISFILGSGEIFFGAMPFGFGFLAASSKNVVYIYIGLCLSAIFGKGNVTVMICAYTIVMLLRILSRIVIDKSAAKIKERKMTLGEIIPMLFSEHILLRMSSAAIGAFTVGVYTLIAGGFFYYDLFGAIISLLTAPLFALLFFFSIGGEKFDERVTFASFCVLFSSVIFCVRGVSVLGISLSVAAAMALTLWFSQKKGIIRGTVVGMCTGLAVSPIMAPAFIFAAVISSLLIKISGFFACTAAATVAFAWALFAEGISSLTTVLPALILTSFLFSAVDKLYLVSTTESTDKKIKDREKKNEKEAEKAGTRTRERAESERTVCRALSERSLEGAELFDTEQRIKVLCETFSSLSNLFSGLWERMKYPREVDIKGICDAAFDSACTRCENRAECWEIDYASSVASINNVSAALMKRGHATKEDVGEEMYSRCMGMPDILDRINKNSMLHTQELLIGDKTEIFALDYEAVSELLAASMVEQREEFEPLVELTERIAKKLSDKKLPVFGVIAYGNTQRKTVLVRGREKDIHSFFSATDKIISVIEDICGEKMRIVERKNKGDDLHLTLTTAEKYRVEYAKRSATAEGEDGFCGDTVNIFESSERKKGKFYSFISDGMGSGREAALTSGICSVFLSKMLGSSAKCDIALKMLNGFLRNKGSGSLHECSATIDLMEFDLVTGESSFYKGGAAPSYVWRDSNLFKLRSNSVPLGIIKEIDVRKISFELDAGDVVVMVSDGVTQSKDECPWLYDLLSESIGKESLASIADMIVKRAKYEGATDDISVVVMTIKEI